MTLAMEKGSAEDSPRPFAYSSPREKPPLLPKYQGYGAGGAGASYRLASLDRLANRQRLFEGTATGPVNGLAGGTPDEKTTPVSYSINCVTGLLQRYIM